MPRRARIICGGMHHHIIQRGNNRSACFFVEQDYLFYLENLTEGADGLSRMMRYLGSRYVQYVNQGYQRTGTLWEGRFKSSLVDGERYLLTCYRYVELNPVRAGMVIDPVSYRWSSCGAHAYGRPNKVSRDHPCYLALGRIAAKRQQAYRDLVQNRIDAGALQAIRTSVNSGLALGDECFKDQVEEMIDRSVRTGKPGWPRRKDSSIEYNERDIDQGVEV